MPTGEDDESLLSISVPSVSTTPPISIEKKCSQPSSVSPAKALVSSSAPVTSAVNNVVVNRERSQSAAIVIPIKVQARLEFVPSSVEAFMFFSQKQESKAHSCGYLVKQSELVLQTKQQQSMEEKKKDDSLADVSPFSDDDADEGLFKFEY